MGIRLWIAKGTYNRIENLKKQRTKFRDYIEKINEWITKEERNLVTDYEQMNPKEVAKFGLYTGYLTKKDYDKIIKKIKK